MAFWICPECGAEHWIESEDAFKKKTFFECGCGYRHKRPELRHIIDESIDDFTKGGK